MEIFWKPLGMGAVAVFIGTVLLWLIPEYKKTPRKAAVAVINIGVALMLRNFLFHGVNRAVNDSNHSPANNKRVALD